MKVEEEMIPIAVGLFLGTLAHFGRRLASDEPRPKIWQVIGYLMQLGLIGLVAMVSTRALDITSGDARALATAVLAISAQEVITYLKRTGWKAMLRATEEEK